MSAAKLNEYPATSHRNEQSKQLAERTQMLIDIAEKAKSGSLTLQETNDLYAEFNQTYNLATIKPQKIKPVIKVVSEPVKTLNPEALIPTIEPLSSIGSDGVDESWAIKLLKESELEEGSIKPSYSKKLDRRIIEPVLCEA